MTNRCTTAQSTEVVRRWAPPAIVTLAATAALTALTAAPPAGVFSVVKKDKDQRSSLYDDAWMPHMLRVTWNGLALHGGPLPGYAASHGCVRMPFGFAEKLFDKVRIGTRVII